MEPLLKGPAGLDYLKNAFANRHGSPSDAYSSVPRTVQWLLSVRNCKDQEWQEHINSFSALDHESSSHGLIPSTTLRSGGSFVVKSNLASLTPAANTTAGLWMLTLVCIIRQGKHATAICVPFFLIKFSVPSQVIHNQNARGKKLI